MASVSSTLQKAVQLHQAGDIPRAEALYRQVLRNDPRHADALHLLGVAALQKCEPHAAVEMLRKAVAANRTVAGYHSNLGAAYRALGDRERAIASLNEAVRLDPQFADAHYNLGTLYQEMGKLAEADACFCRALQLNPNSAPALNNRGIVLRGLERLDEAAGCYRRALEINPHFAEAADNLGSVLQALNRPEEAIPFHRRALELKPDFAEAHCNLANAYRELDRYEPAIAAYQRALELNPDYVAALVNLGLAYKETGALELAVAANNRALEIDPEHVEAHINRSYVRRLKGELAQGWSEFEWRFREEDIPDRYTGPVWDGSSLEDKTILIYAEQGIGDEIMFASCIPDVIALAGRCIVECDARLIPLLRRSLPQAEYIPTWKPSAGALPPAPPAYDVRIAMGSLLRYARPTLESFPACAAYLCADRERVEQFRHRLAELGDGLKVGISWRGGKRPSVKRKRTTSAQHWADVLACRDVQFINLQYGDCRGELEQFQQATGTVVHDWNDVDPLVELEGAAALIAALDLVISIDNATVHLAGALGVAVWNLIPFSPDWRWLVDRSDSPWYPSMRLFRQPKPGDWDNVFASVASQLAELTQSVAQMPSDARRGAILDFCRREAGNNRHATDCTTPRTFVIDGSRAPSRSGSDAWLADNACFRMDANHRLFSESRREFHLSRYRFARDYCAGKHVLDAATGTGYGAAAIAEVANTVIGIDLSRDAVAYANENYGGDNVSFLESAVELTPFEDNCFDAITSFETLEHLIAPRSALFEFVRLLRPDGIAVVSVPNQWGLTPFHFVDFDLPLLRELADECFGEVEYFYNNSGDKPDRLPAGIGPLATIAADRAECILAVCRNPRKEILAQRSADRLGSALEEIYLRAFQRHNELLDLRERSIAAPAKITGNDRVPAIIQTGKPLTLAADDLGTQPGQALLSLETEILEWSRAGVRIAIPQIVAATPTAAQIHLVLPDGKVAHSSAVQLAPAPVSKEIA